MLPAVSGAAVCAAILIAGYAWLRSTERKSAGVNSWDVAGGLMFVGFAAAMLSEPETIMPLFGQFPN